MTDLANTWVCWESPSNDHRVDFCWHFSSTKAKLLAMTMQLIHLRIVPYNGDHMLIGPAKICMVPRCVLMLVVLENLGSINKSW